MKESLVPDYPMKRPAADNEYLHYINHKLGYSNSRLDRLIAAVWVTNILLMVLVGWVYRHFGL